jgi:uncharacterized protein (DUF1697 family)
MADLRAALESLGHTEVATYIQSGNAVMTTSRRAGRQALADELARALAERTGMDVVPILRTPQELRDAVAENPFSGAEPARVIVAFLSVRPTRENVARLEPERFTDERFELRGSELFIHYPNGMGRSKLTLDYIEKRLGVRGTARNLNTVRKLIELAGG